jgi:hypothetical protein
MIQRVSRVAGGRVKSNHAGRGRPPAMPTSSVSTEAIAASTSASVSGARGSSGGGCRGQRGGTAATPSGSATEAREGFVLFGLLGCRDGVGDGFVDEHVADGEDGGLSFRPWRR